MTSVLPGFLTGLGLIVAIGAQNAFVLRQGLRREHVVPVVLVCAVSDALLVVAGVAGLGRLLEVAPWFESVARWAAVTFLLAYATLAARRALRPQGAGLEPGTGSAPTPPPAGSTRAVGVMTAASRSRVVATSVALTWLNPHVYVDTVLLLGSVASTHGDDRWWFAAGAVVASGVWFTALGLGARSLGGVLRGPGVWRAIDATVAMMMLAVAAMLVRGA